jgi:hypothetical protein
LAEPVMLAAARISAALGYRQVKESPLDSAARLY